MALFAKNPGSAGKSRVFAPRMMGFPQELKTVRFNSEPKRYKSVSLSAKRSVFTLVGLAHGVVTEKLRFRKICIRKMRCLSSWVEMPRVGFEARGGGGGGGGCIRIHDTIEGPRASVVKPGRITQA